MKAFHSRMHLSVLGLAVCVLGATSSGDSHAQTAPTLQLPIEVLGDGNAFAREAFLHLDRKDLAAVRYLAVTCHRCTFLGAPEFEKTSSPARSIKTAVRILGTQTNAVGTDVAPWIPISDISMQNKQLELPAAERLQGGLGNTGLYTMRFRIPIDAATQARLTAASEGNRIRFHFYGTDGESNGFRILSLNFQDANGRNLATDVMKDATAMQDPIIRNEKNLPRSPADVAAGEVLWKQGGLLRKSNIVERKLNASCASCHAEGARDLQYFNYSDNSIFQRGRFHGLSSQQARQIVAYVRANPVGRSTHIPQAAPWNPPYQPGPILDGRPLREWAAGAGLSKVLDTPKQVVNALFGVHPNAAQVKVSQQMVDDLMDPSGLKAPSARETAISLQFPDWNAWLPAISPEDVWPDSRADQGGKDFKGSFRLGMGASGNPNGGINRVFRPVQSMQAVDDVLAKLKFRVKQDSSGDWSDWSALTPSERKTLAPLLKNVGWQGPSFAGGGRSHRVLNDGRKYGSQIGAEYLSTLKDPAKEGLAYNFNAMVERATLSIFHWNAVQQWNLVQKYRLDGDQTVFIDRNANDPQAPFKGIGEKRGWALNTAGVFFIGPHLSYQTYETPSLEQSRGATLHWEDSKVGSLYRTNLWYDLAMVINPGAGQQFTNYPLDWPYHTDFSARLSKELFNAANALYAKKDAASTAAGDEYMQLALTHQLREFQVKAELGQQGFNDQPLRNDSYDPEKDPENRSRSAALTQLSPATWLLGRNRKEDEGNRFKYLKIVQPDLFTLLVNGAFNQFNQLLGQNSGRDPSLWRRCDPNVVVIGRRTEAYHQGMPAKHCLDPLRPVVRMDANGNYGFPADDYYETPGEALLYSYEVAKNLGLAGSQGVKDFKTWLDRAWSAAPTAADMEVTTASAPASITLGQEVRIQYTCRNNGALQTVANVQHRFTQATGVATHAYCRVADLKRTGGREPVGAVTSCNRANLDTTLNPNDTISCTTTFRPAAKGQLSLAVLANSHAFDPMPLNSRYPKAVPGNVGVLSISVN